MSEKLYQTIDGVRMEMEPQDAARFLEGQAEWASVIKPAIDKQKAINDLKDKLKSIDEKTIRPLREGDEARVQELDEQAAAIRVELQQLL